MLVQERAKGGRVYNAEVLGASFRDLAGLGHRARARKEVDLRQEFDIGPGCGNKLRQE